MLRRTLEGLFISGTALGALFAMSLPALGREPVERVWASASPVQVFGTAPPNAMQGQGVPPIQLLNDSDSGGEVWFLVDGQEKSLQPGETLDLSSGRSHLVEFNTGGEHGDVRFSLYQGLYKFKVMPEGWGLFKSSSQPSMAGRQPMMSAPSRGTPAQTSPSQVQRSYGPPMPAQDLRSRRMAEGAAGTVQQGQQIASPPPKPAGTTGAGEDTTRSISAPPPPGVIRERARPATTP